MAEKQAKVWKRGDPFEWLGKLGNQTLTEHIRAYPSAFLLPTVLSNSEVEPLN